MSPSRLSASRKTSRRSAGKAFRNVTRKPSRKPRGKGQPRQLALSGRGRWGGLRAGSGRRKIPRDKRGYVPHITRPKVTRHTPVHVTLRCVDGLPSLRRPTHKRTIDAIFARENRKGFRLVHYAILPNHLHLICEGVDTRAISRGIQRIASRIARAFNARLDRRGRFFRERFDGKVIATPKQMRNALRYVLLNHHKHQAEGRREAVVGVDAYSSGHYFDGWQDCKHARPPPDGPVVPPQCWLSRQGWRRHGLIRAVWIAAKA
jgi:REP element-mobilizing transposase RayT